MSIHDDKTVTLTPSLLFKRTLSNYQMPAVIQQLFQATYVILANSIHYVHLTQFIHICYIFFQQYLNTLHIMYLSLATQRYRNTICIKGLISERASVQSETLKIDRIFPTGFMLPRYTETIDGTVYVIRISSTGFVLAWGIIGRCGSLEWRFRRDILS